MRAAGIPASVAEALDATHAVATVGLDRSVFREALAATLVKDEAARPIFDDIFDLFFAVPARHRAKRERRPPDGTQLGGGASSGERTGLSPRQRPDEPSSERAPKSPAAREYERASVAAQLLAQRRALERRPLQELSSREVEECELLVAALAQRLRRRLSRRQHTAPRGRLDIRRTLRRSASTGGVPIDPALRRRRRRRPDLIALCDHSHSVATASHFLIALLLPSADFFRRVHLFAFVDRPVEVSVEAGRFVPHTTLDLYARSDFGRVLAEIWETRRRMITRNTRVVILGDARNNRRPPRGDILAKIHAAAAQVVWLNPESTRRWNTGDSVMSLYRRHCDDVLAASSLRELAAALRQAFGTL